ncbi:anion permease, partial [Propionibacterium freudenreichii]|uniref:anion permease n=1 Tax=Propionibacterium freudenreichii TaxID=1744 RepID=UPI002549C7E9
TRRGLSDGQRRNSHHRKTPTLTPTPTRQPDSTPRYTPDREEPYFFASAVAHISAMYAAFLATALALGAPPMLAAMSLAYTALLSMGLTQYSGGPGPALFGSGYNSTGRWWGVSFLCSIPSLLIWFVVGGAWFKVIGWW